MGLCAPPNEWYNFWSCAHDRSVPFYSNVLTHSVCLSWCWPSLTHVSTWLFAEDDSTDLHLFEIAIIKQLHVQSGLERFRFTIDQVKLVLMALSLFLIFNSSFLYILPLHYNYLMANARLPLGTVQYTAQGAECFVVEHTQQRSPSTCLNSYCPSSTTE